MIPDSQKPSPVSDSSVHGEDWCHQMMVLVIEIEQPDLEEEHGVHVWTNLHRTFSMDKETTQL
jgi:hypothetical protein